jgi:hypothetical protein
VADEMMPLEHIDLPYVVPTATYGPWFFATVHVHEARVGSFLSTMHGESRQFAHGRAFEQTAYAFTG